MEKHTLKRVWQIASSVFVGIILICAILLVALRIFGFQIYTITSGSMEPNFPVGSLIYVAPSDPSTLKVDDVITFMNDKDTVVTHRISEILTETDESGDSVLRFRTKGDANSHSDGRLVHYKNIIGTPAITIPGLGFIAHYLQRPPGLYIALIVCTFLITIIILPYVNKPKRKENSSTNTAEASS